MIVTLKMSDAPINTLTLKGKLVGGVKIKLYPFCDFQQGRWNICISQLIYHITNEVRINDRVQQIKEICGIKCNFVNSKEYSSNNEVETVFQNLNIFILQGVKNDKKVVNFEKKWTLINNLSEELKIYVTNLANTQIFNLVEADFYFVVLLQRIK